MLRLRTVWAVMALALLAGPMMGDDRRDPAPTRGTLPPQWKKLGLTDEQRRAVYKIRGSYRSKIDALKEQIYELQRQEKGELEQVLTDAQKTRLKELRSGEPIKSEATKPPRDKTEPKPAKETGPGKKP